jgi:hypothetical protein
MKKTVIYNRNEDNIREAFELFSQGYKILCPICKSELLILADYDSSSKYQKHLGIYCPKNENHVGIRLFLRSVREEVWKKFYELQEKRLSKKDKDLWLTEPSYSIY